MAKMMKGARERKKRLKKAKKLAKKGRPCDPRGGGTRKDAGETGK